MAFSIHMLLQPDAEKWTKKKFLMKKLLKKYDEEHSGSLDKRELGLLLKELNGDLIVDEKVLEEIWSSTDVNHDGSVDLQELAPALSKWDTSHDGAFDHEDDPNIQIRHLPTSAPKYVVRVGSHNYGSAKGEEFHIKGGSIGGGGGKGKCRSGGRGRARSRGGSRGGG